MAPTITMRNNYTYRAWQRRPRDSCCLKRLRFTAYRQGLTFPSGLGSWLTHRAKLTIVPLKKNKSVPGIVWSGGTTGKQRQLASHLKGGPRSVTGTFSRFRRLLTMPFTPMETACYGGAH